MCLLHSRKRVVRVCIAYVLHICSHQYKQLLPYLRTHSTAPQLHYAPHSNARTFCYDSQQHSPHLDMSFEQCSISHIFTRVWVMLQLSTYTTRLHCCSADSRLQLRSLQALACDSKLNAIPPSILSSHAACFFPCFRTSGAFPHARSPSFVCYRALEPQVRKFCQLCASNT